MQRKKKLLELVREKMMRKAYGLKTQQVYLTWVKEYILFHHKKHPLKMGKVEIEKFMDYITVEKGLSKKRKQEAFYALVFLYTQVLGVSLQQEYIQASRTKASVTDMQVPYMVQSVMEF